MPAKPSYERSLLRRFAAVGLVVTVAAAAVVGFLVQREIVSVVTEQSAELAGEQVSSFISPLVTRGSLNARHLAEWQTTRLDTLVHGGLLSAGVVRIKIWAPDGTLLYSSSGEAIGTRFAISDELRAALEGRTGFERVSASDSENAAEKNTTDLLEVYVPLHLAGSEDVEGAYEIYESTAVLDARLDRIRTVVALGAFGGFFVLFLALYGVVQGAARRLVERAQENERLAFEVAWAYDGTIEGWAAALDLKDKETEGHSRRVTDLTVVAAHELGIDGDDLNDVRRGALLHDIGKMGVPDSILLKPGPLDDAEWEVMHKHPEHARTMLESVGFLERALQIPYCHHERWDGTGYPRGLKGEEIPLPARIFAVVDVWDALSHDRPYRKAWSDAQVRDHLVAQKGSHFDPEIVDVVLRIIDAGEDGYMGAAARVTSGQLGPQAGTV